MTSLPARQQRALDQIEKTLLADDPRLRSMFAIFTRLTRHEAMPMTEQARTRLWQFRPRAAVLSIALIAVLSALVLIPLGPGRSRCGASPAAPAHGQAASRTKDCSRTAAAMQGWLFAR